MKVLFKFPENVVDQKKQQLENYIVIGVALEKTHYHFR
jgi:hypothetical protein